VGRILVLGLMASTLLASSSRVLNERDGLRGILEVARGRRKRGSGPVALE
jgi:hypothetical protein